MKSAFFFTLCVFSLLLVFYSESQAQLYPIQSTTRLVPPYSVYLQDYVIPGQERLQSILLLKDLSQASLDIRLRVEIHKDGRLLMRTSPFFNPPPITLFPGQPLIVSGTELAPYLASSNLEFLNYDRTSYEQNKSLPEGAYQICIRAYEYNRPEVEVSNEGCSFFYLALSEPPLLVSPICDSRVAVQLPQTVVFSWVNQTVSPNSVLDTEYLLELYEVRPPGRNINDVVLSSAPVFSVTTDHTNYLYGPADPPLFEGMQYTWRIRALDKSGRDAFRNQGYSEVCSFTYQGSSENLAGLVANFTAEAKTHARADFNWEADPESFDAYKIYYRIAEKDRHWSEMLIQDGSQNERRLHDLMPETAYEARIQGAKNGYYGPMGSPSQRPKKEFLIVKKIPLGIL